MNSSKVWVCAGAFVACLAIALLAHQISGQEDENEELGHPSQSANTLKKGAKPTKRRVGPVRERVVKYESYEEAMAALLQFDHDSLRTGSLHETELASRRLRALVSRIPRDHYSALSAEFGDQLLNPQSQPDLLIPHRALRAIYLEWGKSDLDEALESLAEIKDGPLHAKALRNIAEGAAEIDVAATMVRMENLKIDFPYQLEGINRRLLIDHVFRLWHGQDPEAALEWNRLSHYSEQERQRREETTKPVFFFEQRPGVASPHINKQNE